MEISYEVHTFGKLYFICILAYKDTNFHSSRHDYTEGVKINVTKLYAYLKRFTFAFNFKQKEIKPVMSTKKILDNFIHNLSPFQRVLISLGLAGLTFLSVQHTKLNLLVMLTILWDVYALSFCTTSWLVFFTHTAKETKEHARVEDGSRIFVFFIILLSSTASLFTVLLLIISKDIQAIIYVPVAIIGMLLSWMMVHTTFTFHYAHLYYDEDETGNSATQAGGLNFPNETKPDYFDFVYFSFIIGMTFQVSDVEVISRRMRRLVLLHSLLSFGLNTFVVALTINLIAGLKNG